MPSQPIPGSTGEVLTCLPSPYLPHARDGAALPAALPRQVPIREGARRAAGELCEKFQTWSRPVPLPASRHRSQRGGANRARVGRRCGDRASAAGAPAQKTCARPNGNRDLVQKGMTPAGQEFLKEASNRAMVLRGPRRRDQERARPDRFRRRKDRVTAGISDLTAARELIALYDQSRRDLPWSLW